MSSYTPSRIRLKLWLSVASVVAIAVTLFMLAGCGGMGSCSGGNPVPSLGSISPSTIDSTVVPVTITLKGSHFLSGSDVYINGQSVTSTYVSPSQLTVVVDGSLIYRTGITAGSRVPVYVNNRPSGTFGGVVGCPDGGQSGTVMLTVN
jgi:IPT/TIG domain